MERTHNINLSLFWGRPFSLVDLRWLVPVVVLQLAVVAFRSPFPTTLVSLLLIPVILKLLAVICPFPRVAPEEKLSQLFSTKLRPAVVPIEHEAA